MNRSLNARLDDVSTQKDRLLEELLEDATHLKIAVADLDDAVQALHGATGVALLPERHEMLAQAGEELRGAGTRIVLALLLVNTKAAKLEALSSVEPTKQARDTN